MPETTTLPETTTSTVVESVTLRAQGRLVIPAVFRKALDLAPGEHLLVSIDQERLVLEKPSAIEGRIHARFRDVSDRSLAAELIEERRREAAAG